MISDDDLIPRPSSLRKLVDKLDRAAALQADELHVNRVAARASERLLQGPPSDQTTSESLALFGASLGLDVIEFYRRDRTAGGDDAFVKQSEWKSATDRELAPAARKVRSLLRPDWLGSIAIGIPVGGTREEAVGDLVAVMEVTGSEAFLMLPVRTVSRLDAVLILFGPRGVLAALEAERPATAVLSAALLATLDGAEPTE